MRVLGGVRGSQRASEGSHECLMVPGGLWGVPGVFGCSQGGFGESLGGAEGPWGVLGVPGVFQGSRNVSGVPGLFWGSGGVLGVSGCSGGP